MTSDYVALAPVDVNYPVADLEIAKGGFSHQRAKRAGNFWVVTPTFGHVNAFIQNVARPRGPSQKKSRTLSDSVVLVNYNFN